MYENRTQTREVTWDYRTLFDAEGFTVFDPNGEKIGKVDTLHVAEREHPRYLGVKLGLLGTKATLIPVETITRVDSNEKSIWVTVTKDVAKEAPTFDPDRQFTAEDEAMLWKHYGLTQAVPEYRVTEIHAWRRAS
jgi:PRC-barrel domain